MFFYSVGCSVLNLLSIEILTLAQTRRRCDSCRIRDFSTLFPKLPWRTGISAIQTLPLAIQTISRNYKFASLISCCTENVPRTPQTWRRSNAQNATAVPTTTRSNDDPCSAEQRWTLPRSVESFLAQHVALHLSSQRPFLFHVQQQRDERDWTEKQTCSSESRRTVFVFVFSLSIDTDTRTCKENEECVINSRIQFAALKRLINGAIFRDTQSL